MLELKRQLRGKRSRRWRATCKHVALGIVWTLILSLPAIGGERTLLTYWDRRTGGDWINCGAITYTPETGIIRDRYGITYNIRHMPQWLESELRSVGQQVIYVNGNRVGIVRVR